MEPLDAAQNGEKVRSSGRRLSSILKAPRGSGKLSDPERVELQVEVAKPVERRISRRVSFAPANNVLLFSKDAEHESPVRTPLQTLSTTDNCDRRVQVGITDKGAQPVTDMETLLNAPLHAAQQNNKEMPWVHHDFQADYGERTVMFDGDEAQYMDVTQSHTVIIANDLESQAVLPELNFKSLPTCGSTFFTFSFDNKEDETPFPVKISSSDHGFYPENVLPRADPMTTVMYNAVPSLQEDRSRDQNQDQTVDPLPFLTRLKALRSVADKENQTPTSSTVMEKPQVKSRKSEKSFNNVFHPGNIVGSTCTNDPLKYPFPTQDICPLSDSLMPTQIGTEVQACTSSNLDDMELTKNQTVGIESKVCRTEPSQNKSRIRSGLSLAHVSPKMISHSFDKAHPTLCQGEEREATMYMSDDMDMTRSQTVAIDAKSLYKINSLQNKKRKSLSFMSASTLSSNVFGDESDDMELTKCQTRATPSSSVPKHGNGIEHTRHIIVESDDMDITRSQTVAIDAKTVDAIPLLQSKKGLSMSMAASNKDCNVFESGNTEFSMCQSRVIDAKHHDITKPSLRVGAGGLESIRHFFSKEDNGIDTMLCQREGAQKSTSEPADMDMTRSQTAAIDAKTLHTVNATMLFQREGAQNVTSEPDDMDMTRSQTVAIDARNLNTVNPLHIKKRKSLAFMTASQTTNDASNECGMDMTKALTVSIDHITQSSGSVMSAKHEPDDMDMTRSQTVAIDAKTLHTVNPLHIKKRKSLAFMTASQTTNDASNECGMDMTKALTVSIDHIAQSSGSMMSAKPLKSLFPKTLNEMETMDIREADSGDMEFTTCQTSIIEAKHFDVVKPLLSVGIGGPDSTLESNENVFSDDMEITRSQTVAIDAKSLSAANPDPVKKRKGLTIRTVSHKDGNASDDECGMHMTKALTVSSIEEKHLDAAKMSLSVCTGGQVSTLESNRKDESGFERICQGEGTRLITSESDDMDVTRSKTVAIDAKLPHVSPYHIKKRKSLAFMTTSQPADDGCGMDMTKPLTVSIDHFTQMSGSRMPRSDKPLNSLFHKASHQLETLNRPEAESDNMEFTMCQTRVIEENNLETVTSSMGVGTRGRVSTLESNSQCLSEGQVIENASQNVCHLSQSNKTAVEEHGMVTNVEETKTGHILNLDDMELTRSQTIAIGADTTRMGKQLSPINQVKYVEKINQFGNQGLDHDISPDSVELDMSRSHNVAAESKYMCTADATGKSSNLDLPQPSVPSEDLSRDEHTTQAQRVHKVKLSSEDEKTKQVSLTDLQSKLRRISHTINEANRKSIMDSCTAPASQSEQALDTNATKAIDLPVVEPDSEVTQTDGVHSTPEKRSPVMAPLNLKSKRLTARLSMGCFIPKLPQRNRPSETTNDGHELSGNMLMQEQYGDINDEVMPNSPSEEDLSESLEAQAPQGTNENQQGCNMDIVLECDISEEVVPNIVQGKKRTLPEDYLKDTDEDDKRRRPLIDSIQKTGPVSVVCDSNLTVSSSVITQPIDSSNSSNTTSLRCETTLESSFKPSLVESQLEDVTDWISSTHKKLDDGNMTMLEFFKCFGVDFVFYNSRQSLPAKLASDVDNKPEDLLRDLHINRPKQRVYEKDYQHLAEIMEGLKVRMKDQEGLVKSVNRPLWDAVRDLSEKELKCFGAKLKEKSKFFRRRAKVQAHEMKEVLYSNLHRTYLEEQQKFKGKVEAVDEMLKSLDDCIHELQTELAAVEGNDLNTSEPTLKSKQQELERVTRETADNERQMYELEIQKKQSVDKLDRLRAETHHLQNHITTLDMLNEWKLKEKTENHAVYTFLHNTMYLEVVFEVQHGDDSDTCERNILDISLKLQLDDEMSQCHARLVHKLLSQYIEEEGNTWVKKYPTSHYLPALLHSVSLAVSRCRLLGEEVLLMKKWGAQRLNLLDISCVDTQVCLLFSSLKAFAKFELTIELTSGYPFCLPQVHNFTNYIGNTTIHQIEEIVFSITPARNYLTKIVKKINDTLLCGDGPQ